MKKTKIILSIKEPLRLGFETLERAQAFETVLHGAVKKADGLFLPEIVTNEYPAEDESDA